MCLRFSWFLQRKKKIATPKLPGERSTELRGQYEQKLPKKKAGASSVSTDRERNAVHPLPLPVADVSRVYIKARANI